MRNDSLPPGSKSYLSHARVDIHPNRISIVPESTSLGSPVLNFTVTADDILLSDRSGLRNPLLCALQRHTKSLWRLYEDGFALEAMPPYRACQLPEDAIRKWKHWQATGEMESSEWEVKLVSNQAKDGHSLIQRRPHTIRRRPRPECEEEFKPQHTKN